MYTLISVRYFARVISYIYNMGFQDSLDILGSIGFMVLYFSILVLNKEVYI
jgi:hypothetical protein